MFSLLAAGGNSRAARSARARLQLRDRYGRWVEMGRGLKFDVRTSSGVRTVLGTFVGALDADTGQVYVHNDPTLPNGFYDVKSNNISEVIADLSPEKLASRGIQVGRDADGNAVTAREGANVPTVESLVRKDAPEGFVQDESVTQGVARYSSEDGDVTLINGQRYDRETGATKTFWAAHIDGQHEEGQFESFSDIGGAFRRIERADQQVAETPERENTETPQARLERLQRQYEKTQNPDAMDRIEAQIQEAQKEIDSQAQIEAEIGQADAAAPQGPVSGEFELRGITPDGFLIPSGKGQDGAGSSPEALAQYVQAESDFLTEGGKRLVIDTETGRVDIYNSAATLDDAKAQAGGIGADHYVDLSTGERIENDKNVGAPDGDGSTGGDPTPAPDAEGAPNDEDRSADSPEPEGADAPAADGVREERRVAGQPAERPAADRDSRDSLERQRDRLNEQWSNTENDRARDRLDRQLEDVERRLAELESQPAEAEPVDTPTPEETEAPDDGPDTDAGGEDADPAELPGVDADRSGDAGDEGPGPDLGTLIARPERWDSLPESVPTPDVYELPTTPEAAERFHAAITKLTENNPYAPAVTVYSPEEYQAMRLFLTEDGTAGFALRDDELISVFTHSDSPHKGASRALVAASVDQGAMRLDAFDTVLPKIYALEGFEAKARIGFDDEYAPEGWDYEVFGNYNGGRPDVVFMRYNPDAVGRSYEPGTGQQVDDYDAGIALAQADAPAAPSEDRESLERREARLEQAIPNASPERMGAMEEQLAAIRAQLQGLSQPNPDIAEQLRQLSERVEALAAPSPQEVSTDPGPTAPTREDLSRQLSEFLASPDLGTPGSLERLNDIKRQLRELDSDEEQTDRLMAAEDAAGASVAPDAPTVREMDVTLSRAREELAGKDVPEDVAERLETADTPEQLDEVLREVRSAPNKANTLTRPREDAPTPPTAETAARLEAELDPEYETDSNVIMNDIRANHPNHQILANGDILLDSRVDRNRRYDMIVRRTNNETFFTYILETDLKSGKQRALREAVDSHSYTALRNRIATMTGRFNHKDPRRPFNRYKENVTTVAPGELDTTPLSRYIEGTDIPATPDATRNELIAALVTEIQHRGMPRERLIELAKVHGENAAFVDTILGAVERRQILDAHIATFNSPINRVPHRDYNGQQVQVGATVDWMDARATIPARDADGNIIYQRDTDGNLVYRDIRDAEGNFLKSIPVPESMPNPDYKKVYRGTVMGLQDQNHGHYGQYTTTDNVFVTFPERAEALGYPASHQFTTTTPNLITIEDGNAPLSEEFWGRQKQRANAERISQPLTRDFSVAKSAPTAPVATELVSDTDGNVRVEGFPDVEVPVSRADAAILADSADVRSASAQELQPGDMLVGLSADGTPRYEPVLAVEPSGSLTRVSTYSLDTAEVRQREMDAEALTVFRPTESTQEADSGPVLKPNTDYETGDRVNIGSIPGDVATVVERPTAGRESYVLRGDADGERYVVAIEDMPAPLGERITDAEAPRPATYKEIQQLLGEASRREMARRRAETIAELLSDPNATVQEIQEELESIRRLPLREGGSVEFAAERMLHYLSFQGYVDSDYVDQLLANADWDAVQRSPEQEKLLREYGGEAYRIVPPETLQRLGSGRGWDFQLKETDNIEPGDLVSPAGSSLVFQVLGSGTRTGTYRVRVVNGTNYGSTDPDFGFLSSGQVLPSAYFPQVNRTIYTPNPGRSTGYYNPEAPAAAATTLDDSDESIRFELDGIEARGANLVSQFNAGFSSEGEAKGGSFHDRAEFIRTDAGANLFVKRPIEYDEFGDEPISAQEQVQGEFLANRVAQMIGINTVNMGLSDDGTELIMTAVEGDLAIQNITAARRLMENFWDNPQMWRIGMLDYLIGNTDRHEGNWLIAPNGTPVPIDHALAAWSTAGSMESPFASRMFQDIYSGAAPLTPATMLQMRNRLSALAPTFARQGRRSDFENMMLRLSYLTTMLQRGKKTDNE